MPPAAGSSLNVASSAMAACRRPASAWVSITGGTLAAAGHGGEVVPARIRVSRRGSVRLPRMLDGRVVLVTGGSGGIGAVLCRRLAAEGMAVAVHYRDRVELAE